VIFPELALAIRTFRRIRRPVRFAILGRAVEDGVVLESETDLSRFDVLLFDLATRAKRKLAAVRSLKVAELDERDFRIRIAEGAAGSGHRARRYG